MAKYKLIVALQLNTGLHSNPVCFNGVFILQTCELTHTHTRLHSGLIQTKMSTSDTTCVLVVTWKCSEGKHGKKKQEEEKSLGREESERGSDRCPKPLFFLIHFCLLFLLLPWITNCPHREMNPGSVSLPPGLLATECFWRDKIISRYAPSCVSRLEPPFLLPCVDCCIPSCHWRCRGSCLPCAGTSRRGHSSFFSGKKPTFHSQT